MEGGSLYCESSSISSSVLLRDEERLPPSSEVLDSLWISSSSPSFHGSASMVNLNDVEGENGRERPFFNQLDKEELGNDEYDACLHQPEKKRRLSPDQVQFLEKSFEVENKLEPERKVQLAKELGLQPRQVAIWFQNRRARYKTKQLEKDYDSLKTSYDKLKSDYDSLFKENENLKNEVQLLTEKFHSREKGKTKLEQCDPVDHYSAEPQKRTSSTVSFNVPTVTSPMVACKQEDASSVACKQEDASSAKSDVFDSDSPHYTDGNHSSLLEPANSSHAFEPELSDFSQDEDDILSRTLLQPPSLSCFPKLEEGCYNYLQGNSCNLGFSIENHGTWLWP